MTFRNILRSSALLMLTAFFTQSCIETDNTTGSGLLPGEHILDVNTISIDLPVQMKQSDSLHTVYSGSLLFGTYKDPDFGPTDASCAFQFIPTEQGLSYGENPEPNSLKLYISISDKNYFYEEEEFIPQNIKVHKLLTELDSTFNYNNSLTDSDISQNSLEVSGNVYFGGDSLVIELSDEFARELLSTGDEERDSIALYVKQIKGLYISADPQPGSIDRGRINITTPDNIYMTLNYRHYDASEGIDKDSTISFYTSNDLASINRFNHSSSNLETENASEKIFVEGLAGIKPYIDFSQVREDILNWASSANISDPDNIVIIKAEIQLPFEYPEDFTRLNYYPSQMFLCTRNSSDTSQNSAYIYEPLSDISYTQSNGEINRSLRYYTFDISSYLHGVIKDNYADNYLKTYIAPIYQVSDYYSSSVYYYFQNSFYSKAILNGTSSYRNPKLILTYTTMSE
jgi:hypothetical protein